MEWLYVSMCRKMQSNVHSVTCGDIIFSFLSVENAFCLWIQKKCKGFIEPISIIKSVTVNWGFTCNFFKRQCRKVLQKNLSRIQKSYMD